MDVVTTGALALVLAFAVAGRAEPVAVAPVAAVALLRRLVVLRSNRMHVHAALMNGAIHAIRLWDTDAPSQRTCGAHL